MEDLNGTFLGDLHDALFKLLSLHGIHTLHAGEMFRRKSGDSFKAGVHPLLANRIAD